MFRDTFGERVGNTFKNKTLERNSDLFVIKNEYRKEKGVHMDDKVHMCNS